MQDNECHLFSGSTATDLAAEDEDKCFCESTRTLQERPKSVSDVEVQILIDKTI